ncbi:MAG: hypothetical protein R3A50_02360 [Saprospiraceae bacterium]
MKKIKIIFRFLLEALLFSLPFFWAPFWLQIVIAMIGSVALELYRLRKNRASLNDSLQNIDFSAFNKKETASQNS